MYEELGLTPCLDPLHSSGLRKFASERDALYEEVSSVGCEGKRTARVTKSNLTALSALASLLFPSIR